MQRLCDLRVIGFKDFPVVLFRFACCNGTVTDSIFGVELEQAIIKNQLGLPLKIACHPGR